MTKCYYCGKADGHVPGCNERPVAKEVTTEEVDAKIVKAVEATVPSGLMPPEQVKAVLEALKSWPDVLKVSPEMRDAWLFGDWDVGEDEETAESEEEALPDAPGPDHMLTTEKNGKLVWVPIVYPKGFGLSPTPVESKPVKITRLEFKDP